MSAATSLQQASLFVARGFSHDAFAPCPLLSVKCMFNGSALYRADRAWFAVNEMGYLILNDQQPYEIHIDSPTQVESFIIFFPRSWAEQVLASLTLSPEKLLDEPEHMAERPARFFERFTPNDQLVSPVLTSLRRAHKSGPRRSSGSNKSSGNYSPACCRRRTTRSARATPCPHDAPRRARNYGAG